MGGDDVNATGPSNPAAADLPWPDDSSVPTKVRDELLRQHRRMSYGTQVGIMGATMMAAAQEGVFAQLDRGLRALDALEAQWPHLREQCERQRAALVENGLAVADLSRERIAQVALYVPDEMSDPAFWDGEPDQKQRGWADLFHDLTGF